jgi:hypothetical protein
MANRYLISSGDSEDPAIYDGGTLPSVDDVLRLNGFVWTVTANRTIAQLRTDALAPAVGSSTARLVLIADGVTLMVTQEALGSAGNGFQGLIGCATAGATATVICPSFRKQIFRPMGTETLNAIGEAVSDGTGGAGGLVNGTGTLNFTGNMTVSDGAGNMLSQGDGLRLNVTGNVSVGSSVIGGVVYFGSGVTLNVTGAVQVANVPLISGTQNWPTVTHNGPCIAGTAPAFVMRSLYQGSGPFVNNGQIMALECRNVRLLGTDNQWSMIKADGSAQTLRTAGLLTGYPVEAKVEDGTVYGPSGEFTGTLNPVNIDVQQLASNLLTEMNASNLAIAQGLRDGMGASAAAIAAVGSINVIP